MNKEEFSNEIRDLLRRVDVGCDYISVDDKNLYFDNDRYGNGNGPYLNFKLYKNKLKLTSGTLLKESEKFEIKYPNKQKDMINVMKQISSFVKKYFKSCLIIQIRKHK